MATYGPNTRYARITAVSSYYGQYVDEYYDRCEEVRSEFPNAGTELETGSELDARMQRYDELAKLTRQAWDCYHAEVFGV